MMRSIRSSRRAVLVMVGLFGLSLSVPALQAQTQGRLLGTVVGADGQPIADVKVTIRSQGGRPFERTAESDEDGEFALIVLDVTLPHEIQLEKGGYQTLREPVRFGQSALQTPTFTMTQAPTDEELAAAAGSDAAVEAYNAGVQAFNAGDLETARDQFESALEQNPDLTGGYQVLAAVYLELGQNDKAVEAIDKYVESAGASPEALSIKFDAQLETGNLEGAAATLDQLASSGRPQDAVRAYNLALQLVRAGGQREAGLARLQQAVSLDPGLAPAYVAMATVQMGLGDPAAAAASAETAIELAPDNLQAHTLRVEAYQELGDEARAAEAEEALRKASEETDPSQLVRQGEALFNSGDAIEAIQVLERALAADPSLAEAHFYLGMAWINQGDTATAREHLERYLEMKPDGPDAPTAREMLQYLE